MSLADQIEAIKDPADRALAQQLAASLEDPGTDILAVLCRIGGLI